MAVHHDPYVAGRYRDGLVSDHWTDVRRCAHATFIAYVPSCTCGWRGPDNIPSRNGYRQCCRDGEIHRADCVADLSPSSWDPYGEQGEAREPRRVAGGGGPLTPARAVFS